MSLRKAFAAVLQFVRTHQGLSQQDIASAMDQSHVSRLEAAKRSVSLEMSQELAEAMQLHPISFLALVYAAHGQQSAREILQNAQDELEAVALLDANIISEPKKIPHPRVTEAAETRRAIQALKGEERTQAEVARMLGLSTSTVGRHWHNT
ncbi:MULTISPECIES: helix-turn-helix domain-containing protein [Pseudomonas]|uniref:helix-turn-helix domain-containing protein n=1 Tax=Pseudomonas TaxID=286 RepID=UPI00129695F7|nr:MULTISPECIES: helix-turn-helix domain-containing protein [Pseudomonas]MQU53416.1 helix-turn-helix domain-containing protein [Pseudomonas sp. FSL R10-1339]WOL28676.1 helix-turn-helix domain-containing protein [Pseudomonas fragi]